MSQITDFGLPSGRAGWEIGHQDDEQLLLVGDSGKWYIQVVHDVVGWSVLLLDHRRAVAFTQPYLPVPTELHRGLDVETVEDVAVALMDSAEAMEPRFEGGQDAE